MPQLKYPSKSHPKYTGDIITEIVNMYQSGLTAQQVADHIGAAQDTILKILRKEGVTRTAGETKSLKLPKDEIIHLYVNKDWSATKIGKKFGTDAHIILNRLRSWNINIVKIKQPKLHDLNIDELSNMYKSNPSSYKIAKHFGVSPSAIQNRLHENGVDTPLGRPKWKQLPISEIINDYESGLSAQLIAKKFNCNTQHVLNYLHANEIETKRTGFGKVCTTYNGEIVRSSLEMLVANWFYENNILYEYEPELQHTRFRPDFKIGDIFIEVCGVEKNRFGYDERLQRKVKFYEDNNLNFILLFPKNITDVYLTKTFIDN